LKVQPVRLGTPKMGGSDGRNSPASPTFNFGGFDLEDKGD